MTVPCCVLGDDRYDCFQADSAAICLGLPGGPHIPGPEGYSCAEVGGCWKCEFNVQGQVACTGGDVEVSCCLEDPLGGGTFQEFSLCQSTCAACGGFPVTPERPCGEPPPSPVGCRQAGDDRLPAGGKRWTLDLVGTVAIGMDPEPDESVEGTSYVQGLSATLTRSVDTPNSSPEDPCGHVRGESVMLDDGYVYTELCSQPLHGDPRSRRRTYAVLRTAEGVTDLQDGYQYTVGAVRLPYWTEAMLRTAEWRCQPPGD